MSEPEDFWATLPLGRGVTLIARDANGLAAFSKPAGILSHPNEPGDEPRSLLKARACISHHAANPISRPLPTR